MKSQATNPTKKQKGNFGEGSVVRAIISLAIPQMMAQIVQVLYNIVDRMYIGHIDIVGKTALTGVGLVFPIVTIVNAFTALFGNGGGPTFSILRGQGDNEGARRIMGNACTMLLLLSAVITAVCLLFGRPILYLMGAGEESIIFAWDYLKIYILGTTFTMFATGLNPYITNQGFGAIGMFTTVIGAVINIFLDPIFIFDKFTVFGLTIPGMDLGVMGAALATILSQFISAVWVFVFITRRATLTLAPVYMKLKLSTLYKIVRLGVTNFFFGLTTSLANVCYNTSLQTYGGDIYVAAMTINNSVKEFVFLSMHGFTQGAQPVISYNYGAGKIDRVLKSIRVQTYAVVSYTLLATLVVIIFPEPIIRIFNDDPEMIEVGKTTLRVYFSLGAFMSLQSCGQQTYVALGQAKYSLFFSCLRKIILIIPAIYVLPLVLPIHPALAVMAAEPFSDIVGGVACFTVMMISMYGKLKKKQPLGLFNKIVK